MAKWKGGIFGKSHSSNLAQNHINLKKETFMLQYRLEATRGNWGGIWQAPAHYSLTSTSDSLTNIQMIKKFGSWDYSLYGIRRRVPWVNQGSVGHTNSGLLTLRASVDDS